MLLYMLVIVRRSRGEALGCVHLIPVRTIKLGADWGELFLMWMESRELTCLFVTPRLRHLCLSHAGIGLS